MNSAVFSANNLTNSSLRRILWQVFRRRLGVIALFSAVINILMLAPSIYMLQVYDRVLASANEMTLLMLTGLVMGLFVFMATLEWLRSVLVIRLGTQMDLKLNKKIFRAVHQAQLNRRHQNTGQALSDLTQLRQFATGNALFAFFDAPWFPVYLAVLFLFHPALGWLALGGAVLLVLLAWGNHKLSQPGLDRAAALSLAANQQASSQLQNSEVISAMGMLPQLQNRWLAKHTQFLAWQNQASDRSAAISAGSKGVRLALQSLILGLGAWLVLQQEISAGMMIAGSILMGRVLAPIDLLIAVWKQFSGAQQAFQRLERLLHQYQPQSQKLNLPQPRGELLLQQAAVAVPGAQRAIVSQLNFALAAGESLGVLGSSGSGKSTLARLMCGAVNADAGVVRLDGADLRHWDKQQLGQAIGYLPQDVQLFAGSVADNIARFSPSYEQRDDDIIQAAQMAGVHQLILQLANGYDTLLGENGSGLSGGQRQRIGLARALFSQPKLIVLDEPNANLDQAGEMALQQTIQRIQQAGSTLVMITHKAELLNGVDKLLVLEQGNIRAFGTPEKVLQTIAANQPAAGPSQKNQPQTSDSQPSPVKPVVSPMPSLSLSLSSGGGGQ